VSLDGALIATDHLSETLFGRKTTSVAVKRHPDSGHDCDRSMIEFRRKLEKIRRYDGRSKRRVQQNLAILAPIHEGHVLGKN
jgi:hypothetical protein